VHQAPARLDEELAALRVELREKEAAFSRARQKRKFLEAESTVLAAQRQQVRQIYLFVGRVEQALKNVSASRNVDELRSQVQTLGAKIAQLRRDLDPSAQRDKLSAAIDRVSGTIAEYARLLHLEHAAENVRLNVRELTLQFSPLSGRTDFLWEVGSGQNWVGYHVAGMLALHEHFISMRENPVPNFLVIDQPSQVYFPEAWPSLEEAPEAVGKSDRSPDILNSLQQQKVILGAQLANLISQYEQRCLPVPGPQDEQFCAAALIQITLLRSQIAFLESQIRQVQVELLLAEAALKRCLEGPGPSSSSQFPAAASIPPASVSTSLTFCSVTSVDPNAKLGVTGTGEAHFIRGTLPLSYTVLFENKPTATASAAEVVIMDKLSQSLEPTTLQMRNLRFGLEQIDLPQGEHSLSTIVDLTSTLNLFVKVTADVVGDALIVNFVSIDPLTGMPPNDLRGFLPPNINRPDGEGSITFTIMPKQGLSTGDQITNGASIVFDKNSPILTPVWLNTVDNDKPVSNVLSLPSTQTSYGFSIQWSGTDKGSGIKDYTIYVSDNAGPFTPILSQDTATQATYAGTGGHTYSFYSIARDLSGNVEDAKTVAEATTRVITDATPPVIVPQITGALGNNGWYLGDVTVSWSVTDPESGIASSSGCKTTTLTTDTAGATLTCSAQNGAGLSSSVPVTIKIDKTAPVISGLPVRGCALWPPNHKLVQVAEVTASDALSGLAPETFNVTGTSNEPSDPNFPQIAVTPSASGGLNVQLLADRLGTGTGRIYTLTANAMDLAGNSSIVTATCSVPHDQDK
jgi:hypothetical protein